MNTILMTGSHGFIGSHVGAHLLKHKYVVKVIPRDLLYEQWNLRSFIEAQQPDIILHFGAYGNHSHQTNLLETIESNIVATANLLEASKGVDYKTFINTSTSSVHLPVQTYYSASKCATEKLCQAFAQQNDTNVISIRPYSVYGDGEAEFRFIPKVIRAAKYGEPLDIVLEPKHDWIFIDDFVSAVQAVIEYSSRVNLGSWAVDIGTGISTSNQDVFDLIEWIANKPIKHTVVESMRSYDTQDWVCDTRMIKALGWNQHHTLEDGLKKTYASY